MKTALLDVNVLLALAWSNHQHHAAAHHWFDETDGRRFATCSLTQLAFIRLSSNPSFTAEAVTPREVASLLRKLCQTWDMSSGSHRLPMIPRSSNTLADINK